MQLSENEMKSISKNLEKVVYSFKELDSEILPKAGGKGSALAQLLQLGYPVPDGFVILPSAFRNDELRAEAWDQVQFYLSKHRKRDKSATFAVRSSALAEDSAFAAFAGQFETILGVKNDDEILTAIHTVFASKRSERVEAYSKIKGIDFQHEIAVIIQQLVDSEISGVLFTADPVTGSINTMSGSFIYGMGDQLVSGESDAFQFELSRPKGKYKGPEEFKKYSKKLYSLASKVEKDFKAPQDIEWAIWHGKLYLLQSRPITTLIGYDPVLAYHNESLVGDYFWTFTGVGELVPNILKPSDWSIWKIYNTDCSEHNWFLPHMMYANIAGRLYTNGSVMVSAMRKTFYSEERIKDLFQEALGEIPSEVKIPYFHISWKKILTQTIPDEIKWQRKVKRLKSDIPIFLETFPQMCQ
ncbi:MAG: phosphoenolpyruvate synthase, partial [Candidatus Heimdallarchaeota archaeon]|nr:phosphoenolpyruvate synthase [Candidatus Heimdallarchaeota archaeon]